MKKIYIKYGVKLKNRQDVSNVLNCFTSKKQDVFKIDTEKM